MRSLKEICEGLLAGQDAILNTGNNIEDEFDLLKRSAQNKKNWIMSKLSGPASSIRVYKLFLAKDLPLLCSMFDVKNPKTLYISISGSRGGWRLNISGLNESDKSEFNVSYSFNVRYGTTFAALHKDEICPLFDNLDNFIKFIESKIRK